MNLTRRKACVGAAAMAAWVLVIYGIAMGSPESRALIRQGHAELTAAKYEHALKKFSAASQADANDAEAVYFEGVALNRLGRFKEALARLEKAGTMGFKGPGLSFDTGWALLRLGRWIDAVVQLETFEKTVPGRGKTSEFLGQAYFGLKQYDRAEAKLQEAIQRDPRLKPTALFHLASLERERKNRDAEKRYIETLLREAPDSAIALSLRKRAEWRPAATAK